MTLLVGDALTFGQNLNSLVVDLQALSLLDIFAEKEDWTPIHYMTQKVKIQLQVREEEERDLREKKIEK